MISSNNVNNDDILNVMSIEELAHAYKNVSIQFPHIYSFIKMSIRWKNMDKINKHVSFWSPRSCRIQDGTFIALLEFDDNWCDLVMCTLENSCESLCKTLRETKTIKFNECLHFYSILEHHTEAIVAALHQRGLEVSDRSPCFLMSMPRDEALALKVVYDPEIYIESLDTSSAKFINDCWDKKYKGSENTLATLIQLNGGLGVFLRYSRELVAWVIRNHLGQIGILQTVDSCRRKGYATLLTTLLAKQIAGQGDDPCGTISQQNVTSINMFQKIGFRIINTVNYFTIEPKRQHKSKS